jgi:hypothetical protein
MGNSVALGFGIGATCATTRCVVTGNEPFRELFAATALTVQVTGRYGSEIIVNGKETTPPRSPKLLITEKEYRRFSSNNILDW